MRVARVGGPREELRKGGGVEFINREIQIKLLSVNSSCREHGQIIRSQGWRWLKQ